MLSISRHAGVGRHPETAVLKENRWIPACADMTGLNGDEGT